jgi:hypothetical protein
MGFGEFNAVAFDQYIIYARTVHTVKLQATASTTGPLRALEIVF